MKPVLLMVRMALFYFLAIGAGWVLWGTSQVAALAAVAMVSVVWCLLEIRLIRRGY